MNIKTKKPSAHAQAYLAAATAFVLNQNFPGEKFIWENPFENEKNVFNQEMIKYFI